MQVITHTQDPRLLWYVGGWIAFCLYAVGILLRDRVPVAGELQRQWAYLTMPWELASFIPGFLFVTFAGRFTDDETWDVITGGGMTILAFLTAPWCLGMAYQVVVVRRPPRYLFVAAALPLFSSSWFYDGYLLLRDGSYTTRWWSNLMLSPILYLTAGCLWNLEASGRFVVRLGFVRKDWPSHLPDGRLPPIVFVSIPLLLIAAFILVAFVQWRIPSIGR